MVIPKWAKSFFLDFRRSPDVGGDPVQGLVADGSQDAFAVVHGQAPGRLFE